MSPRGRPEGECRRAQLDGHPMLPLGRPEGECRRAQLDGRPMLPLGRPEGECRRAQRDGRPMLPLGRPEGDDRSAPREVRPERPPRRATLAGIAMALALGLGACAAPRPPATLLTLPPSVPLRAAAASPLDARAPTLALRRVGLPEYLLARRVRYRADAATLADWPDTYWAERIEVAASREFAAALRATLPGWSVCEADCAERAPALALQVDLGALDAVRGTRRLQARARWVVSAVGAGSATTAQITQEQDFDLPIEADSPQAQAQAMTELLRQLAQASAAAVLSARR